MLQRLIDDMNKALDHDCFLPALAIALILPDICGKAKYPTEQSTKKRYVDWYDECIGQHEQCPGDEGKMAYLSGEVVYQLRCEFLHQGNPNIDKEKIKEECCKIDRLVILTEKKKEVNILFDESVVSENGLDGLRREYCVGIRRLCSIISAGAQDFYKESPDSFDFFHFEIKDVDDTYAL